MLAKIRHFGPYTFFISGSAADFHWPELIQIVARQYGAELDLHYIENEMDKKTKKLVSKKLSNSSKTLTSSFKNYGECYYFWNPSYRTNPEL